MVKQSSPFLRLPPEIRLMIYEELLLPSAPTETRPQPSANHHDNDQNRNDSDAPPPPPSRLHDARRALQIRTLDPTHPASPDPPSSSSSATTTRPRYLARDPHRARTITTTYALLHNPGLHPAILHTCRQCYTEALPTLYAAHTFDFDTHVEAIVPFLSTLGCVARRNITSIAVVKRVLPAVGQEFEQAEWRSACAYMARELVVPQLRLVVGVVGAAEPAGGWGDVPELTVEQLRLVQPRGLRRRRSGPGAVCRAGGEGVDGDGLGLKEIAGVDFEWVQQLFWLHGLSYIQIEALAENNITPPASDDWAFWMSFSRSIDASFREWVHGLIIHG